ncbi:MAG: hypothetical protein WAM26_09305 [Nitrososphaeraceae archaeon]
MINNKQVALDSGQVTLDQWLVERLRDKLAKTSLLAGRLRRPILLYKKTMEESEQSAEEEIATVSKDFIIVQVITYGGFISPSFQQQYVFTPDKFASWVMHRSRELVMQCLENIEELSQ